MLSSAGGNARGSGLLTGDRYFKKRGGPKRRRGGGGQWGPLVPPMCFSLFEKLRPGGPCLGGFAGVRRQVYLAGTNCLPKKFLRRNTSPLAQTRGEGGDSTAGMGPEVWRGGGACRWWATTKRTQG